MIACINFATFVTIYILPFIFGMFIFWPCFSTLKRAYEQRIKRCKKTCHIRKLKERSKNKQTIHRNRGFTENIFYINWWALISENAVFSFKSHRHASVFRCFPDSLFFWRLTGNNHLTSATNWRLKVTRLMPGKKSINIKGILRLRLGHPETVLLLSRPYDHLLKSTL